jgi:AraC-like DNA-binding protein
MGFRSNELTSRFASETFPDTRFLTGQKSVFVTLSRGLLGMPPRKTRKRSETCPDDTRPVDQHWDFAGSLRQVLSAYLIGGAPTIQFAAELADTSVRTLQRRLAQADLSYSDLVRQARFELASTMLRNTDRKIIGIAYELGYTDPAHFTRAFGRLAGMSPSEYRVQRRLQ